MSLDAYEMLQETVMLLHGWNEENASESYFTLECLPGGLKMKATYSKGEKHYTQENLTPGSFSPDGNVLAYVSSDLANQGDIWMLPFDGEDPGEVHVAPCQRVVEGPTHRSLGRPQWVMPRVDEVVVEEVGAGPGAVELVTVGQSQGQPAGLRRGGQGLISPATLEFMMRNHLPGDIASMGPQSFAEQPMEGMGFGIGGAVVLDPGRARSPGSVGDFSWGGMASTFFWVDPVNDLSVVFFTQLSPSSSYPARPQLKALVHGALA